MSILNELRMLLGNENGIYNFDSDVDEYYDDENEFEIDFVNNEVDYLAFTDYETWQRQKIVEDINKRKLPILHKVVYKLYKNRRKYEEVFYALIASRIDVRIKDEGNTILHTLVRNNGSSNMVKEILRQKRVDVNAKDQFGETVLHALFGKGIYKKAELERVVLMLLKAGANPNIKNRSGQTVLDIARQDPSSPISKILKKKR